jgi:hypothetical protein
MPLAAALARTLPNLSQFTPPALRPEQRFELLSVEVGPQCTRAAFFAREDSLVTSKFPGFDKELIKILPNLLTNVKCYNGQNHHFGVEMLATETGHLFEHIWLEVLCCEKLRCARKAHFCGETSWNWKRDPRGLFHVTIDATDQDKPLVEETARISMRILEKVLA